MYKPIISNELYKEKIETIIYKRMNAPELIEKMVPKTKWSKQALIDYIYFLEDQLNDYQE
jgi:hypothetical protein